MVAICYLEQRYDDDEESQPSGCDAASSLMGSSVATCVTLPHWLPDLSLALAVDNKNSLNTTKLLNQIKMFSFETAEKSLVRLSLSPGLPKKKLVDILSTVKNELETWLFKNQASTTIRTKVTTGFVFKKPPWNTFHSCKKKDGWSLFFF